MYEVGGRHGRIADREKIETIDLHFYPDGACCLGLQLLADRKTTLKEFMDELVVPFFYGSLTLMSVAWQLRGNTSGPSILTATRVSGNTYQT